jgi:hypothetical protein
MAGRQRQGSFLEIEAIDAQREAVQRLQENSSGTAGPSLTMSASLFVLGAMLLCASTTYGAGVGSGLGSGSGSANDVGESRATSTISGVVRDVQGVAQMGALVQILTANAATVATAFTDQHGHYVIANLKPGKYLVRASATLFVPVTRVNLELRTGATAIVNLTLAGLYDAASWLPAQRRRADESPDDWKWTLRSTANRPILRIVEDGQLLEVSSSAETGTPVARVKARAAVEGGSGGFGQSGVHSVVTIHQGLEDGSDVLLRANLGLGAGEPGSPVNGVSPPVGLTRLVGNEVDAGFEGRTGFNGGASRTVVSYKSHPELMGTGMLPGGAGVEVLEMTSAQRIALGEYVEVEAGGRLEAIHAGETGLATHPFVRLRAHPAGRWTLEYRLTGDRGLQEFDDVTSGDSEVPVALMQDGKLTLESGKHQEVSVEHRSSAVGVQLAVYQDNFGQAALSGGVQSSVVHDPVTGLASVQPVSSAAQNGMLFDPMTGSFRALGGAYSSTGVRVTASSAITPTLWVAAEYATGEALADDPGVTVAPIGLAQALANLRVRRTQTATLALKGRLLGSGTRVRASYRWQPTGDVTAVDAYGAFGDQAYLSFMLRQPIRLGTMLPPGLEASIDVTNLLAQGYRPFLSADGQTLFFAQAPRTIQAGLSFNF